MAKRTNMMVPASWTGQDRLFAESLKESVDCLIGQRGDKLDKAVTVKDLLGSGLAVLPAGSSVYSGVPNDLTTPPVDDSTPNLQTPPAPTNLTANGAFQNILLSWNLESYSGHSGVDVYRHTSDSITDATLIGRASGSQRLFSDSVGGGSTFYYWVRAFNQNGDYGPYNSSSGTVGTTQSDVAFLLNELTDEITSTQLVSDLTTPISLITADASVTGSVAYKVAQEASARASAIVAEASARTSAIASETASRNSAIQAEQTARISAIATESSNRASALTTEASTRASDIASETTARVSAISAETSARTAAIATEAASRASAITAATTALQNQINDLLDIDEYDANDSYVTDDQVTYLNKLYKATQNTTGNLPTNTTYWDLLGNYSSLGDLVGSNTSSITAINTVSATSSSAAAQAIHGLNSTVNDPSTGVSATSSALDTVETLVNHSDTGVAASATKISVLETTVNDAATGVAATSSALDTVETLVNHSDTGVAASATKISALETTVNDPNTGVSATSGALDTVETLVNHSDTGVAASATKIGLLETTVNDAATGVAATSSALDTVETLVNHSDTGVAASATKISNLETTVNDAATGVAATSGALDTVETLVNHSDTGVAASATKISALETTVNDADTGVAATSSALDTVETLVNHSDTGVAASATKISALETTVNDAATGVAATSSALDTVETLVNHSDTGVAASATKISALETTVNDADTGVAATSGALDTVETLVNHADTGVAASATKISALETTVNDATTGLAATSGALDTVETLVNHADTGVAASATKISALETTVNDAATGVSATSGALDTVETLVNHSDTGVAASATKISALEATVNDADSGVSATAGALDTVETLVNHSDTGVAASATKISALETTVNDATTGVAATSSALDTVETLVNNSDTGVSATATKVSNLETTVNGADGNNGLAANFAVLNSAVTDTETGLSATASSVSGLLATVGDSTSGLVQSTSATASESSATATDIDNLISSLNTANSNTDTTLDAAIINERQIRIDSEASNATLISGINSTLSNKTQTFAQDDVPTSISAGDLWVDTNDDNKLYRATIAGADAVVAGEWVPVGDTSDTTTTFAQNDIPTSGAVGDLWIDTNDDNKVYRAESIGANEVTTNEWVLLDIGLALATATAVSTLNTEVFPDGTASASRIDTIASELSDPANGSSTLATQLTDVFTEVLPNGSGSASSISGLTSSIALKPNTSFSATAPTASAIGDLWINSANNNKLYRAESIGADEIDTGEWVLVSDNSPTTSTFSQDGTISIPVSLTIGDLWINTGDDNKLYRAESVGADQIAAGEWILLDVGQALQSASTLSTLKTEVFPDGITSASRLDNIDAEFSDPSTGTTTLAQNFTSVLSEVYPNGTASASSISGVSASLALKPNTFAQNSAPTATAVGDIWVDTDNNNKLYRAESVGANEVTTGEWVAINDTTPTTKTFTGSSVPTAISIGDLWVNTENDSSGNPKNHLYRAESIGADQVAAGEWVFVDLGQAVSTAGVVNSIETEVFPNGSASASSISQISAAINDVDGDGSNVTLQQRFSAQADTNDDLEAQYSVKIDNNGAVSGFGLSSTTTNGTPTSAFIVNADKFAIIDPDTEDEVTSNSPDATAVPFGVSNGNVYIKSAFIEDGSITTAQIGTATIGTAQITGTLSANQIDSNTIAANSIDASKLNIDGSSITSVDVNGVPTLQLGDVNVNKLTGTSISASIMSGTSVFANKLSGDVNTLVPFRTFVTQQYGGSETTMVETELPASSHPDGHKPFAIATGYIQPRFERVYRFKMYMKTTTSTSNSLGNPTNAVFTYTNGIIYRYIDFTGDISGSVSNGWTLTSGSKTGTVTNVSIVSGNTRIYYSGSVAFATTDSITASSGTGYQLVGESRMKAATATKMSFAVSGSKADADAGTITMKVTVTQHNSSDTSLDSFTSTVFINEVSGMIMGVR